MGIDHDDIENRKSFPIGYVALSTGLSPHVIRVWERRYQAVAPERKGNRRRLYSQKDIDHLKHLKQARMQGRRIGALVALDERALSRMNRAGSEIETAGSTSNREWHQPILTPFEILQTCKKAVWRMDAPALSLLMRRADAGLPRTTLLSDVVAPLMHRIGDDWSAKRLGIMHEHVASNVVREFLSDLLNRSNPGEQGPNMVVTTPAGQRCELGALAAGLAAADCGWKVFYFGPDLPSQEIAAAAAVKKADAVCLSITCGTGADAMVREIKRLRRQLPDAVQLHVGGRGAGVVAGALPATNFHVFSSLSEFVQFISLPEPASNRHAAAPRLKG